MQITDVRLKKVTPANDSKVRALCSIVFDGMFVVHDLRVMEGINGLFVGMPRRKSSEGEYKDTAHPITAEARDMIQSRVLQVYHEQDQKEEVLV